MCIGMGWQPDFPSAAQYLGAFFASDGALSMTRLGATPSELREWGYDVTHVPSLDDQIERCEQELGAGQAACWARLDQYVVTPADAGRPDGISRHAPALVAGDRPVPVGRGQPAAGARAGSGARARDVSLHSGAASPR